VLVVVVAVAALGAVVAALDAAVGADPLVGVAADGELHAATSAPTAMPLPATSAFRRVNRLVNYVFLPVYSRLWPCIHRTYSTSRWSGVNSQPRGSAEGSALIVSRPFNSCARREHFRIDR